MYIFLEVCMLPREEGLCHESQIKYYFDRTKLMCVPFEYSGCSGNENNFDAISVCESYCNPIISMISTDDKSKKLYLIIKYTKKNNFFFYF
jgi:hypothetical protein